MTVRNTWNMYALAGILLLALTTLQPQSGSNTSTVAFLVPLVEAFSAPRSSPLLPRLPVRTQCTNVRHATASNTCRPVARVVASRLAAAAGADGDRNKEDDKAKTYQVIMDHIANLEDAVEKKVGVGVTKKKSGGTEGKSASPTTGTTTSTTTSKNPLRYLRGNSPTDGKNRLVFMLAFMTGVADVAMVLKYKNFATMMTGNTMWLASHTVERSFGLMLYLLAVIGSYMGGLAIFRRVYMSLKEQSLELFAPMITAAFLAADYMTFVNPMKKCAPMCLLSASFGIINAVGTDMAGTLCFVVTGHMTKIANAIVDRISGLAGKKRIDMPSFIRSAYVCVGFFLGAFAAFAGVKTFPSLKDHGLLSLMGTVYGGLFLWQDANNNGGWWKHAKSGKNCEIDKYDANCD